MNSNLKIDRVFVVFLIAIGISILIFLSLLSFNIIGYSVQEQCQLSQEKHGGDCIEALIEKLNDETDSYRSRNNAIWALGQMGDSRALPALESYYVGYDGGKSRLDERLSQYELQKAIRLVNGFNITAWVWRGWF